MAVAVSRPAVRDCGECCCSVCRYYTFGGLYTPWNVWKERNRRVFDRITASPRRVLALIKEEMQLRAFACSREETPVV
jgi:hypothetical protein